MRYARLMLWPVLVAALVALTVIYPATAAVAVLNYFSQTTTSTGDNALTLGGTVTRYGVALPAVKAGTGTLDGLNPTVVTPDSAMGSVDNCVVTQEGNAAPGDDPVYLTVMSTAGVSYFEVYAWQNTSGTDPTLVASTNSSATFNWICTGS